MTAESRKHRIRSVRGNTHHALSFVCHLQRINSEQSSGGCNTLTNRHRLLIDHHLYACFSCHLIDTGSKSSAGRILHRMDCTFGSCPHCACNQRIQRCHIRLQLLPEIEPLAVGNDRHSVIAQCSRHNDLVARCKCPVTDQIRIIVNHADSCGVDHNTVEASLLHHLCIAGDDRSPRLTECLIHRRHDPFEISDREPLLNHHRTGQGNRPCTHHRKIIDRP